MNEHYVKFEDMIEGVEYEAFILAAQRFHGKAFRVFNRRLQYTSPVIKDWIMAGGPENYVFIPRYIPEPNSWDKYVEVDPNGQDRWFFTKQRSPILMSAIECLSNDPEAWQAFQDLVNHKRGE